jgi:hypothetical protein
VWIRARLDRAAPARRALARAVAVLLALAVAWFAAMALLLALKVDPGTVEDLSGYRTIYDRLARLTPSDATPDTRLVTGLAGLGAFALFGWLAVALVPRPRAAAGPIVLLADELGAVTVLPRALESAARFAAERHPAVEGAGARYDHGHLDVSLAVGRAEELADTLRDVDRDVVAAMERHDLPVTAVSVTVTRYRPSTSRELR